MYVEKQLVGVKAPGMPVQTDQSKSEMGSEKVEALANPRWA
jgi:hypothetical protein